MTTKYRHLFDYDGFMTADGEIYKFACCDCGLVHYLCILDEDKDKHGVAFKRDNRATAQLRRNKFGNLQNPSKNDKYKLVKKET